jgi:hypothetical protein
VNVQQLAERVVAEARATGAPLAGVARRVLEEAWDSLSDRDRRELLACGLGARVKAARPDADPDEGDGHE